jgi:hypothetical protein
MIRKNKLNNMNNIGKKLDYADICNHNDNDEIDLRSSGSMSIERHMRNGNASDKCTNISIKSSKRIIVADDMSKVERVVFPLEGVKFLSLNNRSHLEGNLNPRKLGIVDSVLRDLELKRLTKEPIQEEEVTDVITAIVEESIPIPPVYPEKNVIVAKNPFIASIQYDCLENSADIIYKLIKSVRNNDVDHQDTAPDKCKPSELNPLNSLEIIQAQRLEELTRWRLKLMGKVSEYNKCQSNEVYNRVDSNAIMN